MFFFSGFSLLLLLILLGVGTARSFTRGGGDFAVFYQAWNLVWTGQGIDVYRISPDRFLYAPGFAWLFAPLGALPPSLSLGLWCGLKVCLLLYLLWRVSTFLSRKESFFQPRLWAAWDFQTRWSLCCCATLFIARPLLVDFEYGQVNLFILVTSMIGLIGHFEDHLSAPLFAPHFWARFWDVVRWTGLSVMAVGKLFPLPLLCVPWIATRGHLRQKLLAERFGILLGIGAALLLPLLTEGFLGTWHLFQDWVQALISRGLPLESHNQSFIALLHHYLSGQPTQVLSEGPAAQVFGWAFLSSQQIFFISAFWMLGTASWILFWLFQQGRYPALQWIAILVGLLILPSHLVWKPYFVMGLPLAILLLYETMMIRSWFSWIRTILLFALLNFTSFDLVGHVWGARFESASILMWVHLSMIGTLLRTRFFK